MQDNQSGSLHIIGDGGGGGVVGGVDKGGEDRPRLKYLERICSGLSPQVIFSGMQAAGLYAC